MVGVGLPVALAAWEPVKFTTAPHELGSLLTAKFAGQVIVGAISWLHEGNLKDPMRVCQLPTFPFACVS